MQRMLKATNVVLILLCAMYFISYIVRQSISTQMLEIRPEFGLTATDVGFVFSAFAYPYLLFQIIGGITADKFGPRKTLFISGLVWAGATILTGLATGLTTLFLWRVLMGFGVGATLPTATRAMQHWVETRRRGFAQGITHSFSRLGNSLTPIMVVAHHGHRRLARLVRRHRHRRLPLGDRVVLVFPRRPEGPSLDHAGRARKAAPEGREARARGRSLGPADQAHVARDADLFLLRLVPLALSLVPAAVLQGQVHAVERGRGAVRLHRLFRRRDRQHGRRHHLGFGLPPDRQGPLRPSLDDLHRLHRRAALAAPGDVHRTT